MYPDIYPVIALRATPPSRLALKRGVPAGLRPTGLLKRSQHFPPKNGVQTALIPPPLRLEPIQHVGVHASGDLLLYGPVEASPDASHPRLVRQLRNVAGVDRLVRQRRQLGQVLALRVGQRRQRFRGVANHFRFHSVASLAAWPVALK